MLNKDGKKPDPDLKKDDADAGLKEASKAYIEKSTAFDNIRRKR